MLFLHNSSKIHHESSGYKYRIFLANFLDIFDKFFKNDWLKFEHTALICRISRYFCLKNLAIRIKDQILFNLYNKLTNFMNLRKFDQRISNTQPHVLDFFEHLRIEIKSH